MATFQADGSFSHVEPLPDPGESGDSDSGTANLSEDAGVSVAQKPGDANATVATRADIRIGASVYFAIIAVPHAAESPRRPQGGR